MTGSESGGFASELRPSDLFAPRHIGPRPEDIARMLETVGAASLDELIQQTVPESIRRARPLELPEPIGRTGPG